MRGAVQPNPREGPCPGHVGRVQAQERAHGGREGLLRGLPVHERARVERAHLRGGRVGEGVGSEGMWRVLYGVFMAAQTYYVRSQLTAPKTNSSGELLQDASLAETKVLPSSV